MSTLSLRLQTVLELLEPCRLLADVGTDHGLIPAHAIDRGLADRALAIDVLSAPLAVAERTLRAARMLDRVSLVHADGLATVQDQGVDAAVIAGMGGESVRQICEAAPAVVAGLGQLIVQPNGDAHVVRDFAQGAGLHLRDERMICERKRFFVTCRFTPGSGPDPAYEVDGLAEGDAVYVGPLLVKRRDPVAGAYFDMQRARLAEVVARGGEGHRGELEAFERASALCPAGAGSTAPSR